MYGQGGENDATMNHITLSKRFETWLLTKKMLKHIQGGTATISPTFRAIQLLILLYRGQIVCRNPKIKLALDAAST